MTSRSTTRVTTALVGLATLVLAGCGSDDRPQDMAQNLGFDPAGPIPTLPECDDLLEPVDDLPDVEGLVLPDGAVKTSVTEVGPLIQVSADVPRTPVGVREHYEERSDVRLLGSEDEVFEAELLLGVGGFAMHVTAMALCDEGSGLEILVSPAGESTPMPELAGPGTTSTPRLSEPEGTDEVTTSG